MLCFTNITSEYGKFDLPDICISAAYNTNIGIIVMEYQVTGLSILPAYIGTIAMLHGCSSAMSDDIAAAGLIIEHPIHKAGAVQPVRAVCTDGGAARRYDVSAGRKSPNG